MGVSAKNFARAVKAAVLSIPAFVTDGAQAAQFSSMTDTSSLRLVTPPPQEVSPAQAAKPQPRLVAGKPLIEIAPEQKITSEKIRGAFDAVEKKPETVYMPTQFGFNVPRRWGVDAIGSLWAKHAKPGKDETNPGIGISIRAYLGDTWLGQSYAGIGYLRADDSHLQRRLVDGKWEKYDNNVMNRNYIWATYGVENDIKIGEEAKVRITTGFAIVAGDYGRAPFGNLKKLPLVGNWRIGAAPQIGFRFEDTGTVLDGFGMLANVMPTLVTIEARYTKTFDLEKPNWGLFPTNR